MEKMQDSGQYLTFTLGSERFALNIEKVKEVLEHTRITKIPRTPDHIRGVINLRGRAVPIVDMRLSFGMPPGQITVNTCLIIVEAGCGASGPVQMGARVDSVCEVAEIFDDEVESPSALGLAVDSKRIAGMAKRGDGFVLILDPRNIFSDGDLESAKTGVESLFDASAQTLAAQEAAGLEIPLANL